MEDDATLLLMAAKCRRLAEAIPNANDPVVAHLLQLAQELEARIAAVKNADEPEPGGGAA